ncbi:22531_t:CDS:1, partial [Dentiscutata erythropus]
EYSIQTLGNLPQDLQVLQKLLANLVLPMYMSSIVKAQLISRFFESSSLPCVGFEPQPLQL